MGNSINKSSIQWLLAFVLLTTSIASLTLFSKQIQREKVEVPEEMRRVNVSNSFLQIVNLGHKRLISSYMWIETLLNADTEDYKGDDHSWLYYRFTNITTLDPKFLEAYLIGTQYLHVLKGEFESAYNFAQKGLIEYPNNYWLHYHSAMISHIELNDTDQALGHYHFLVNHPKSRRHPVIHSIYSKLISDEDSREEAFLIINEIYESLEEGHPLKDAYKQMILKIKADKKRGP